MQFEALPLKTYTPSESIVRVSLFAAVSTVAPFSSAVCFRSLSVSVEASSDDISGTSAAEPDCTAREGVSPEDTD